MKVPGEDELRIARALEGLLSAEERAAFTADVLRDPALRAAYAERAWLHGALWAERERLSELLAPPAPPPRASRWPWLAGLAAAVAVGIGFLGGRGSVPRPEVAVLVHAENTRWAGSSLPTLSASRLGPGLLSLAEGIATVRFASGAVLTLEAPTRLEILSAMSCRLIEGSITAEVPEPAHGFTIEAPELRVVDLGTRFGLTASSTGNSHVYVFSGEVEVTDHERSVVRRLTAGKAYLVGAGPATAGGEPRRGPPLPVIDGWTAVTTSDGRGRDSYVRRGTAAPAGAQPLLLVKHSDLPASRTNERRAILTFDLGELPGTPVSEAELVLDPEPSGYGFTAMVPDSRFAVYGVRPGLADDWDERRLSWDQLPACADTGVVASEAERLGEFVLPRGASGAPLTIRGEALAAFVRQCQGGLATFLILRETGETDPTGLVHAFASKEHPTARPPTLRVR
jgi:ferric-dicitrate binding protein FerR (iron transport regulator)